MPSLEKQLNHAINIQGTRFKPWSIQDDQVDSRDGSAVVHRSTGKQ